MDSGNTGYLMGLTAVPDSLGAKQAPLTEIVCPTLFQFHAFLSPGRCPLFLHTHVHTCSSQAIESGTNIFFFNSKCLGGSVSWGCYNKWLQTGGEGGIKRQKYIFPQFWDWKSKIKVPHCWVLVRSLSVACRWHLLPHRALPWHMHAESTFSLFLFLQGHQFYWIITPSLWPHASLIAY